MTAVDHTSGTIAGANIYAYNNVQFRVPDNDFSTKIADYTPRLDTGDSLVRPTNNFVSCSSNNVRWTGFQLYIVNTGGAQPNSVWSDPTYQQKYLLRYEINIEFKQPIYTLTAPIALATIPEEPTQDGDIEDTGPENPAVKPPKRC